MCACTTSAPKLHCEKAITHCPNVTTHAKISKKRLCPVCHAARHRNRAEITPAPRRTQRLTPLAFVTQCTQVYCENTEVRTLPYFQTYTWPQACHTKRPYKLSHLYACTTFAPGLFTLRKVTTPCFPQCSYAPHVRLHHICTSITL